MNHDNDMAMMMIIITKKMKVPKTGPVWRPSAVTKKSPQPKNGLLQDSFKIF